MKTAFIAEGPNFCFLVVTKTDGERLAIDAASVTSVEQQGPQVILHWLCGETARTCRLNADVESLVTMLVSAGQTPVVDFAALAQGAFGR